MLDDLLPYYETELTYLRRLSKEFAARYPKIAARLHGARSSDADVDRLVKKIATRGDDSYLDVYALGFTNNPTAIGPMAVLARDPDEYVRLAAISSLGTLGAVDQLELLTSIYRDGTLWQDDEMIRAGAGPKTGARMGHMSIDGPGGTIAAFARLGVTRRILIHMNNTNPVLLADSPERAAAEAAGWEVAWDGMEVTP